jgi:choline-sulfatase
LSRPLRYTFILGLFAVGTLLAALGGWRYARASAPVNGPIILVSVDSLRADRLPVYGYASGTSPAIDALARDGIVFERAYSHVPQTLPAHAALLTGRLPFEHGVRDGAGFVLKDDERTLAEILGDRGYATAGITSSFLLRKATGIGQGFTLFDSIEAEGTDLALPLVRDGADAERIAERWLDTIGTTRAFLFIHLAEPAIDAGASPDAPLTYDARITKADDIIGRLIRYLKTHQLYDQSTIIVVADHGQGLGEHGEDAHGLRLDDAVLRVPLIVKPAAGSNAAMRVATPVQHIDIVPTVLDLAKAPAPGALQGQSLVPLFAPGGQFGNRTIYAESLFGRYHFGAPPIASVTDGRFRMITSEPGALTDTAAADGADVSAGHQDVVARLVRALEGFTPASSGVPPSSPVAPADRARLERLGYVGTPTRTAAWERAQLESLPALVNTYRAAVRQGAAGQLPAALASFRSLTEQRPDSADLWNHLAGLALRLERYDAAAAAYRRVIELTPDDADGYLALGDALVRLRKYDEARAQAARVVNGSLGTPAHVARAHELVARIALLRRNYDVARAAAALAESADESRPVAAYVDGRIAFDQRRYADAAAALERVLAAVEAKQLPPFADARLFVAEAMMREGRLSEAEYLFIEQLKETPASVRAIAGLTAVYKDTGRTDEALALARR